MPRRHYSSVATVTSLTTGVNTVGTTLSVGSVAGWPASVPFTVAVDRGNAAEELVEVTAVSGTSLTVTRAVDGTTAKDHSTGAPVLHVVSARDLNEPNLHINDTARDDHTQYLNTARGNAAYEAKADFTRHFLFQGV